MAGLYFHIPFCKQACHYCDFHFSTSLRHRPAMLDAMVRELTIRADYLDGQPLETIYLGGGTPSLLGECGLRQLLAAVETSFTWTDSTEVTLEANPDDLNTEYLEMLADSPVNRLSIGIQSFAEADLRWMNRAHNAHEARQCLELALAAGFDDLSIDLIYGSPTTPDEVWAENLAIAFDYPIPHLSCYALTVEERTALHHQVKTGQSPPVRDAHAAQQMEYLMAAAQAEGYEHYEISNFARMGRYARHNTNYWKGVHYLGIGPSAHSFNGHSRRWNVANNAAYIKTIEAGGQDYFEEEQLTATDRYNEAVMTGLRTMWGVQRTELEYFGEPYAAHFLQQATPFLEEGILVEQKEGFALSPHGRLLADGVASALFYT